MTSIVLQKSKETFGHEVKSHEENENLDLTEGPNGGGGDKRFNNSCSDFPFLKN